MIFILGGNGFVGSAFSRYCTQTDIPHKVITRQNYADHVGKHCDVLISSHGNASKVLSRKFPQRDYDISVTSTQNALFDFNYKKFVLISSCDIYHDHSSPQNTKETTEPDASKQNTYGFHKLLAEKLVMHHAKKWLIVRLGGMIGDGLKKNPIYDILHGGPMFIDPSSEMQFINTDDVARIVMEINHDNEIFNICGDGKISLNILLERYGKVEISDSDGIPKVIYDVNVDKIKKNVVLPTTKESVISYCDRYRKLYG